MSNNLGRYRSQLEKDFYEEIVIYPNGLILFKAFRALQASDCEVDFLGLCIVCVPKKFVDASQAGQQPSDRGVAVICSHGLNVFPYTAGGQWKWFNVFHEAPIDKRIRVGVI